MGTNPKKLYTILFILCLVGYGWLFLSLKAGVAEHRFSPCLIKNVTSVPCPSCGSTRSVLAFIQGHFKEAFFLNPLGFVIVAFLAITPAWLIYDKLAGKKTLYYAYGKIEKILCRPAVYIPLIGCVCIIWIWNIIKGI